MISVFDVDDLGSVKNFELVYNSRDMARILRSNLSAPTAEFPVALISNNIELFLTWMKFLTASGLPTIELHPLELYSGTLAANSVDVFSSPNISILSNQVQTAGVDLRNSRNFDLPLDMFPELMEEIVSMIGINLRDPYGKGGSKAVKVMAYVDYSTKGMTYVPLRQIMDDFLITVDEDDHISNVSDVTVRNIALEELEFGFDVTTRIKSVKLSVDSANDTVALPEDFVDLSKVGVVDSDGVIRVLRQNKNLNFSQKIVADRTARRASRFRRVC